jgi:hypothetical protein
MSFSLPLHGAFLALYVSLLILLPVSKQHSKVSLLNSRRQCAHDPTRSGRRVLGKAADQLAVNLGSDVVPLPQVPQPKL